SKSKRGLTALVLHGGPGAGCFPNHVNFFSPHLYEHVVLMDQRGCGRSVPRGQTQGNTLKLLVDDVEMLRRELHSPWDCILGGSWGCTLGLAYAHTYPNSVRSMVLRGVCLFRPREIDWLFGDPPLISEEEEEEFITSWSCEERRSVLHQYHHRLLGSDPLLRARASQSWFRWEMGIYSSGFSSDGTKTDGESSRLLSIDNNNSGAVNAKITITTKQPYPLPPCIAIQGGKDAICPPDTALDLHHVWKELELRIAFESGHSMYDTVIASEIVKATDRFGHALM
ncbi:hypothetical protein THAPSDRAFT_261176, partial [Thalassiosira pseudonana CCMP1335]